MLHSPRDALDIDPNVDMGSLPSRDLVAHRGYPADLLASVCDRLGGPARHVERGERALANLGGPRSVHEPHFSLQRFVGAGHEDSEQSRVGREVGRRLHHGEWVTCRHAGGAAAPSGDKKRADSQQKANAARWYRERNLEDGLYATT